MTEQQSNVLRDARAKIRTVADMYEISPDEVARIWLKNGCAQTGQKTGHKPAKPAARAQAEGAP